MMCIRCRAFQLMLTVLLLSSWSTLGIGGQVGNGGKGVICRSSDGAIQSAQLLDFFEERSFDGVINVPSASSAFAGAREVIDRLAALDPKRHAAYTGILERVASRTFSNWTTRALRSTGDSDHVVQPPPGCHLEQLAIQRIAEGILVKPFTFQETLFEAMPMSDRIGLLVHEVIYFDAMRRGHLSSRSVREMTVFLATERVFEYDLELYSDFLQMVELSTYEYDLGESQLAIVPARQATFDLAFAWCQDVFVGKVVGKEEVVSNEALFREHYGQLLRASNGEIWLDIPNPDTGRLMVASLAVVPARSFDRGRDDSASIACISPS